MSSRPFTESPFKHKLPPSSVGYDTKKLEVKSSSEQEPVSAPAREHWAVKMRRELEELKSENNTLKLRVETLSRAKRQAKKLRSGGGGGDDDPDSDDSPDEEGDGQARPFDSSTYDLEIVVVTEAHAQSFKVRVSEWTFLSSLKNVIYGARPAFYPSCQELLLNGNQLANEDMLLIDLGNPRTLQLEVDSDGDDSYNIDIRILNLADMQYHSFKVNHYTTVGDVKCMMQGRIQIISIEMALLFNGNHLRNERELFDELEIPEDGSGILNLAFLMFGSGKKVVKKDGTVVKQGMISTRKEAISRQCAQLNVARFTDIPIMIDNVSRLLRAFYDISEENPLKAFKMLLGRISDKCLGNKDSSEILDVLKGSNKGELRLENLHKLLVRECFSELHSTFQEMSGVVESASLTADLISTRAFFNPSQSSWNWQGIKRAIEDEMLLRKSSASSAHEDELSSLMEAMEMAD